MNDRCFCACHEWSGIYPSTREKPCPACGHVHAEGWLPGAARDGWEQCSRVPADRLTTRDELLAEIRLGVRAFVDPHRLRAEKLTVKVTDLEQKVAALQKQVFALTLDRALRGRRGGVG